MNLYPAIDLKDGQCVRLQQGDRQRATIFNDDPTAQAKIFEAQGFSHLHIVDLDGAFAGRPINRAVVEGIVGATDLSVQLGGGIRDLATIETWLTGGVARVILGTAALHNPDLVAEACRLFQGHIMVGIDARDGSVAVEGWAETSTLQADELALRFRDVGVSAIIYTDIERDGLLAGLNITATQRLAKKCGLPVIASGGLAGLEDIEALLAQTSEEVSEGIIEGVIAGRALYDGRLDAKAALDLIGADLIGANLIEKSLC